ncbi:MAG TPA: hypothetical protein VI432_02565 [Candidatus Paceibacterota bacterium]
MKKESRSMNQEEVVDNSLFTIQDSKRGVVTIPLILVISGVVMEVAIVGVIVATILGNTAFNERLHIESLSASRAGAEDAIVKIIRHGCSPRVTGCPSDDSLNPDVIAVGDREADVWMVDHGSGAITVYSVGKALTRRAKTEVELVIDGISGRVDTQSFKEVPL